MASIMNKIAVRAFPIYIYIITYFLKYVNDFILARQGGFEPPVRITPNDGLANRWFKPLTHCRIYGLTKK